MCRRCGSDGALTSTFLLSYDDLMIVVKSLRGVFGYSLHKTLLSRQSTFKLFAATRWCGLTTSMIVIIQGHGTALLRLDT